MRKVLISYHGAKGEALDRSWFSKLTSIEDTKNKKLTLKSPTEFIGRYIEQHYQYIIQEFCQEEDYQLIKIC